MAAGEKSLAVRITFGSEAHTLTDEQVEQAVHAIMDKLRVDLGARQRA